MPEALDILDKELNPTQKEILIHIFKCDGEDNSIHLAGETKTVQPHVYRSCQDLVKRDYLRADPGKGNETFYRLTRKGLDAAFLLDINYDQLLTYSKNHYIDIYNMLVNLAKGQVWNKTQRVDLIKSYIEYGFANNLPYGPTTPDQKADFALFIATRVIRKHGLGNQSPVKELVNRYGVKKSYVRSSIDYMKNTLKNAEKELDEL